MKNSKLLANNWVITLTATLVGVFLALYLNEWISNRNLRNQKSIATENIFAEIASNKAKLEKAVVEHNELLDVIEFLSFFINDDEDLVAHVDSMNKFKSKYPSMIKVTDSTHLGNDVYHYKGKTDFEISVPHLQLTTIAWRTIKNSGISNSYGFDCLMFLERTDNLTNEIFKMDNDLLEYISKIKDSGKKNQHLIMQLKMLISYEESLISVYDNSEQQLQSCD